MTDQSSPRSLFGYGLKRAAPPQAEGDTVLRVHFFDDFPAHRQAAMAWTLRFDDVLDAERLHRALSKLLEMGSWRKLGGRFRLGRDGGIDIHIPEKFSDERPAIRFSHAVFDNVGINEHPLASRLPKSTDSPSVQPSGEVFRLFAARPGAPETLEDFLNCDEPQLSLHVTSFADATLVGLSWLHVTSDAMGVEAIVRAMSLVLAGRDNEVMPLAGAFEDVLLDVGVPSDPKAQESYALEKWRMGIWQYSRATINLVQERIRLGGTQTNVIFLPAWFLTSLRQEAEAAQDLSEKSAFISDGDILSAWCTRMVMTAEARPQPAIVGNSVDIRGRLPIFEPNSAYVQNLVIPTFALLSAKQIANGSLGYIASEIRTNIKQQITEPQIRTYIREYRQCSTKTTGPLYGESTSKLILIHNWTRARFFDVIDFSAAVIAPEVDETPEKRRLAPLGKLVSHHYQLLKPNKVSGNVINILGKDSEGNYWIQGFFHPVVWTKIQQNLASAQRPKGAGEM